MGVFCMKLLIVSTWCPVRCRTALGSVPITSFARWRSARCHACQLRESRAAAEGRPRRPCAPSSLTWKSSSGRRLPRSLTRRGLFSTTPRSLVQAHHAGMQQTVNRLAPRCDVALGLALPAKICLRHLNMPKVFEEASQRICAVELGTQRPGAHATLVDVAPKRPLHAPADFAIRTHHCRLPAGTLAPHRHWRRAVSPWRSFTAASTTMTSCIRRVRVPRIIYRVAHVFGKLRCRPRVPADNMAASSSTARPQFMVTGSIDGVDLSRLPPCDGVRFTGRVDDVKALIAESACRRRAASRRWRRTVRKFSRPWRWAPVVSTSGEGRGRTCAGEW